jgi:hypothetical protein
MAAMASVPQSWSNWASRAAAGAHLVQDRGQVLGVGLPRWQRAGRLRVGGAGPPPVEHDTQAGVPRLWLHHCLRGRTRQWTLPSAPIVSCEQPCVHPSDFG